MPESLPISKGDIVEQLKPSSHLVFRISYKDRNAVLKMPSPFLLNRFQGIYYGSQDYALFHSWIRNLNQGKAILREARKLDNIPRDVNTPRLLDYDDVNGSWLIREFIPGKDFRSLTSYEERKKALRAGLDILIEIHSRNVVIGDAHVKQILAGDNGKHYWLDFDGDFDETNLSSARARDILKFLVSSYTASGKNPEIAIYTAGLVHERYPIPGLLTEAKTTLSRSSALRLWYPARFPLDGVLKSWISLSL